MTSRWVRARRHLGPAAACSYPASSDELIAQKGKVILDLLLNSSTSKQRDPDGSVKALATKAIARL